jgi:hypothetical protein
MVTPGGTVTLSVTFLLPSLAASMLVTRTPGNGLPDPLQIVIEVDPLHRGAGRKLSVVQVRAPHVVPASREGRHRSAHGFRPEVRVVRFAFEKVGGRDPKTA